ncbi:hypothetical protein BC628DRAFT_1315187 [Trametes gibbosa]|nr:hypothetical protein BC628DRAFT_1315187 [Trametes gibbosa]
MEAFAAAEPALKQDEVFRRAFALPYVKSTFCRHCALWRGAGEAVRREYEQLGRDPRACWGEFARRVEGREELATAATAPAPASMQDAGRRQTKRMRGRTGGHVLARGQHTHRPPAWVLLRVRTWRVQIRSVVCEFRLLQQSLTLSLLCSVLSKAKVILRRLPHKCQLTCQRSGALSVR